MKKSLWILIALVALVIAVAVFLWSRRVPAGGGSIDLVEAFPEAEKRTPAPSLDQAFALENVAIGGERKRCIYATPPARIIWTVVVPRNAWLETAFGMREDSWDKPDANGAQFRIGISDGAVYDELLRQVVNPSANQADRRWQTVSFDLSPWAGRRVQVIFNTDAGVGSDGNTAYDFSVWGEPRIVIRK